MGYYTTLGEVCSICYIPVTVGDVRCGPGGRPYLFDYVYAVPGPCIHVRFHPCSIIGGCDACGDYLNCYATHTLKEGIELALVRWEPDVWWFPLRGRWVSDSGDEHVNHIRGKFKR